MGCVSPHKAIFDECILHVIVTKTINFVRYIYCNKRKSTENWLGAKVNVVQIQKTCFPRTQLTEVYQHRAVPQKLWKRGTPLILLSCGVALFGVVSEFYPACGASGSVCELKTRDCHRQRETNNQKETNNRLRCYSCCMKHANKRFDRFIIGLNQTSYDTRQRMFLMACLVVVQLCANNRRESDTI